MIRVDPLEFAAYTRAAREEWPTLSGPSALSLEEVGLLVRDVASRRLRLAWDECTVGQVNVHAEETCIGAGRRIAEFIACVDRIDVEAVVHDVEHEFSKGCNPSLWAAFSSKIVPESYEGRYPRPLCPIDRYRRPSIDDRKPPPSATPVQAQGQADARSRTEEESAHVLDGGDRNLVRDVELETLVTHWAEQRLTRVYASRADTEATPASADDGLDVGERIQQLAEWLGAKRVEELVAAVERAWTAKVAPDCWKAIALCHVEGDL